MAQIDTLPSGCTAVLSASTGNATTPIRIGAQGGTFAAGGYYEYSYSLDKIGSNIIYSGTDTSVTFTPSDNNIGNGVTIYFAIKMISDSGSVNSNIAAYTVAMILDVPKDIIKNSVKSINDNIIISWSPVNNATQYDVSVRCSNDNSNTYTDWLIFRTVTQPQIETCPANYTAFTVTDKSILQYKVRAVNGELKSDYSATIKVIFEHAALFIKSAVGYKKGIVYIKTINRWIRGEKVYIKTTNGWREAD